MQCIVYYFREIISCKNESLNRDLIAIQMPHGWIIQDESKQTTARSNRVEAVFASGSKGLVFKRNNIDSFAKEIIVTMLCYFLITKLIKFAFQSL